jgi:hypothetical protein
MKPILLLTAILLIAASNLFAQNIIDPKPLILNFKDCNGVNRTDSLKYSYFPQDHFILGWQWGQHPKISNEMNSNMYQTTYWEHELDSIPGYVPPASKKINAIIGIANCFPYFAQSFQYEPTLLIPVNDRGKFITRQNDRSNPIFGFALIFPPASGHKDYALNQVEEIKIILKLGTSTDFLF